MTLQHPTDRLHSRKADAKAAYSKDARKRLIVSRSKLDGATTAVRQAITVGGLKSSKPLDLTVESAWENLAHSIRNLVARFADESHQGRDRDV